MHRGDQCWFLSYPGFLLFCAQGEANAGFDVLMSNMKADITASKELGEFIKER